MLLINRLLGPLFSLTAPSEVLEKILLNHVTYITILIVLIYSHIALPCKTFETISFLFLFLLPFG